MSSSSSLGSTNINLQFNLNRSIDAAAQDVQAAISRAGGNLPPNMPSPPSYDKVNPASSPVMYLTMSADTMTPAALDEYAETLLARRISMVSGVAQVQVYGAKKYAVRVQADPDKLATREVGLEEVRDALSHQNVNLPAGSLYGWSKSYTIQSNSQLTAAPAVPAHDHRLAQRQSGAAPGRGERLRQRDFRQELLLDGRPRRHHSRDTKAARRQHRRGGRRRHSPAAEPQGKDAGRHPARGGL